MLSLWCAWSPRNRLGRSQNEKRLLSATLEPALLVETFMLRWALTFLAFALVAGLLGFTGIAGDAMYIARVLFYIFVVVFLMSLIYGAVSGRGIKPI